MKISMIAIIGKNRELGKEGHLLFHIKDDMRRFRDLTRGHVIIMGRKTFESKEIGGKPLPNKTNIVVTRDNTYRAEGAIVVHSLEEAIEKAREIDKDEIFIIGGRQIYELGLPHADKLYLTRIDAADPNADAFFPDYSDFNKVVNRESGEENGIKFEYVDLERE